MAATQRAALPAAVPDPKELAALLGRVERRLRLARALDAAASLSLPALGATALGLALLRTGIAVEARACFGLAAGLPLLGLLLGALRPMRGLLAARSLDRVLGTPDLVASAVSFMARPERERTPFMQACVRTANRRALDASPAAAAPFTTPRALPYAAALGCGVLLLSALRVAPPVRPPKLVRHEPRLLQQDDIDAVHQANAKLIAEQHLDPQVRDAAQELNALLEALRDERLDRARALAELRGLEQRLTEAQSVEDDRALREALRRLGATLDRDSLTQSVADAFREGDAGKAKAALQQLAGKLEDQASKPAARRELAKALSRAGQSARNDKEQVERAKRELDRLLHKRSQSGQAEEREQRLLKQKQRELDKLQREERRNERAERKLDELRRELDSAGRAMGQGRGGDARDHAERGAQQLDKAQREQTTAEQRQRLAQRVQDLRELLTKQRMAQSAPGQVGKKGEQHKLDVESFARSARGPDPRETQADSKGPTKPGSTLLAPDPNATLIMPGGQSQEGSGTEMELKRSDSAAGNGGHPELSGQATRPQNEHVDTRVRGIEGEGPTRSQVIREAGQHGFVSRDYQRVHTDYERHAEAVLDHDKVPGGYRFYVRRYFQLIRPREESP
jgi:hypothetical protein